MPHYIICAIDVQSEKVIETLFPKSEDEHFSQFERLTEAYPKHVKILSYPELVFDEDEEEGDRVFEEMVGQAKLRDALGLTQYIC